MPSLHTWKFCVKQSHPQTEGEWLQLGPQGRDMGVSGVHGFEILVAKRKKKKKRKKEVTISIGQITES